MSAKAESTDKLARAPWLTIVGLGLDAPASLSAAAQRAIREAESVFGSARQLALVDGLIAGERVAWPSPLASGIDTLFARRGRPTCVLASGDPFFYGIGSTLAPRLVAGEFRCHSAPSSISLAAARLGWPLQDTEVVSLHGRALERIVPALIPGRRALVLSWDQRTAEQLAELLCARGFGDSSLHVLEQLGGAAERVRTCRAAAFDLAEIDDLNVIGLELRGRPAVCSLRASLPDEAFEHDGQLTKQDVRALSLSALAPRPGALLWDVGAGAGSIAIEWLRAHPSCRALAFERDLERAERIKRNAAQLGVPELTVVHGSAPECLQRMPTPDAVFVGGGAHDEGIFTACFAALAAGGRLVVNSVSLESEALLLRLHRELGGELRRFSIESAAPLGSLRGWRAAMPIVQWRINKGTP